MKQWFDKLQQEPPVPALACLLVLALTTFTLFADPTVRPSENPVALSDLYAARALVFSDATDGSIRIAEAVTGTEIAQFSPGTNGFARGLLRGLARERRRFGVEMDEPYLLGRNVNNRLMMQDPELKQEIVFDAFGSANRNVFEEVLERANNSNLSASFVHISALPGELE